MICMEHLKDGDGKCKEKSNVPRGTLPWEHCLGEIKEDFS